MPKTPRGGGALNLGGGQPTLDKNGGTTHFVQEWGGHEILTWNGGCRKISSEFGGVQEIYLKDWKMGGGTGTIPEKFFALRAHIT